MTMEKNGMLTDKSNCDFDLAKKAVYYDQHSEKVASESHKDKLVKPVRITPQTAKD